MAFRIAGVTSQMGDQPLAARRLVEAMQIDCLLLRYLDAGCMSGLAWEHQQQTQGGFVQGFPAVVKTLGKQLGGQSFQIVTDAGGLHPQACAAAVGQVLREAELGETKIGVVTGDDLSAVLPQRMQSGQSFVDVDHHQTLSETPGTLLHAHAHFGSAPVLEALSSGAQIVIAGQLPAASLVGGACAAHFGWEAGDNAQLAGAAVAAQVLQGGAAATGGDSTRWSKYNSSSNTGYPVAVIAADGSCIVTRPPRSGGVVNRHTVIEQLLTKVESPQRLRAPDVVLDLSTLRVEELPAHGGARAGVQISNATGKPPGSDYSVSVTYHHGYTAAGLVFVYGRDCVEKAEACAAMIFDRLRRDGYEYEQISIEYPGAGQLVHPASAPPEDLRELTLRIAARDNQQENIARFIQELATLKTTAPAGITLAATPQIEPAFVHRNTLIPRDDVQPEVSVRTAGEWAGDSAG